jgi:predicted O-linked N-acetylglucosamine transferase (SPINDLY family)
MYLKNLQSLQNQDFYIQDPVKEFGRTNFYLAYQGFNDKEAQEQFAKLFRHIPVGHYIPHPPHPKPRIGFISKFLHPDHTIGKFMRGLIEQLSRKTFQVIEFTLTDIPSATNIIGIPLPILNLQESIRLVQEQEIDLLFYPEIGMDPTTYFLAMSRLAPIQCTTWGHPVTTGIPTIDYFISAECIELETAQEHYTEELIRFENLPTYYKKPIPTVPFKNRNYFGLSESHHLYACPQALFKLHPDMDDIFKEILRQDPLAQIILINHAYEGYKKTLLNRWQTEMPDVMERILFLRRLSYDEFLQLINICDVVLDTLHFGGGNTSFEIFSLGIPIVTLPADYMRGRVTYGCYQKMGINTCIAKTPEEYIEIAIKLGTQSDYRTQIKTEILQKNQVLYENQQAVLEFEDFFLKALQTAQVTTSTL